MFNPFSDPLAWHRTNAMAGRVGVDLARAVVDGWLHRDELNSLVATCGDCGKGGVCVSATIPCPNSPALEALRP
jgi:hypothetical protein